MCRPCTGPSDRKHQLLSCIAHNHLCSQASTVAAHYQITACHLSACNRTNENLASEVNNNYYFKITFNPYDMLTFAAIENKAAKMC